MFRTKVGEVIAFILTIAIFSLGLVFSALYSFFAFMFTLCFSLYRDTFAKMNVKNISDRVFLLEPPYPFF